MSNEPNGVVDVKSNADGLGVAKGMPVLDSVDVGDYQGQTVVLLQDDEHDSVHLHIIFYGSCGGCDWYEDFYGKPVTYKDCLDSFGGEKPRYIFPRSVFANMPASELYNLLLDKDGGYQSMTDEYGWTLEAASGLIAAARDILEQNNLGDTTDTMSNSSGGKEANE